MEPSEKIPKHPSSVAQMSKMMALALSIVHCQVVVVMGLLIYTVRDWNRSGSRPRHNRVLDRAAMAKAASSESSRILRIPMMPVKIGLVYSVAEPKRQVEIGL
jgi:hypothetical protein